VTQRVLVAGVGNIFLGDDGFGVEVARRLARLDLPAGVAVGDYGISGMHLAYDLADGVETAILVDAMPRGGEPGTVYVVEPERQVAGERSVAGTPRPDNRGRDNRRSDNRRSDIPKSDNQISDDQANPITLFDGHGMQPDVVLSMLGTLGAEVGRVLIVGCEPATAEPGMELSAPVAAAVDDAVRIVLELIESDVSRGGSGRN
jgi:hydrogenase maturation protease